MMQKKLAEAFGDLVARLARHLLEMFLAVCAVSVVAGIVVCVGYYLAAPTHIQYFIGGVPIVLVVPYVIWRTVIFNIHNTNQFFADLENRDE